MTSKERLAQIKQAAATLATDWPHKADVNGFTLVIYTQANATADESMLVLAQAAYLRGVKVVIFDANACQRTHPLRVIPSVFLELNGEIVAKLEVEEAKDAAILDWFAIGGKLDLAAIRAKVADEKAAKKAEADAKALAKEEEAIHQAEMKALVAETVAKDETLSPTARAFMGALLEAVPADLIAPAARKMIDAVQGAAKK